MAAWYESNGCCDLCVEDGIRDMLIHWILVRDCWWNIHAITNCMNTVKTALTLSALRTEVLKLRVEDWPPHSLTVASYLVLSVLETHFRGLSSTCDCSPTYDIDIHLPTPSLIDVTCFLVLWWLKDHEDCFGVSWRPLWILFSPLLELHWCNECSVVGVTTSSFVPFLKLREAWRHCEDSVHGEYCWWSM